MRSANLASLAALETPRSMELVGTALLFISLPVTSLWKKLSGVLQRQQTCLGACPGYLPKFHSCSPILNSCWILSLLPVSWYLFHYRIIFTAWQEKLMLKHCGNVLIEFIYRIILQANKKLTPKLTKYKVNSVFHYNCHLLMCAVFLRTQVHPDPYNKFCEFLEWSQFWAAQTGEEWMKFHSTLGKE